MKIIGPRPATVRKYAEVAAEIRDLCMRQQQVDFRWISKTYRVGNQASYTLVTLGIVENTGRRNGDRNTIYAWRNPNNLSDVEIAKLVIDYSVKLRIAKGKNKRSQVYPRQTTLPTLQSIPPKPLPKDSYHSRISEPPKPKQVTPQANGLDVNVVRLRMFGLTIFEYETRGKN